jgi:putative Mg2+ transporter-C (MgtC) family protein
VNLDLYKGQLQTLALVGVAMLLGAIIGLDRELEDKPAGLRTHMLVGGAAALFVALVDVVIKSFSAKLGSELVRSDPVRIIEAVVTGVGFLGAGTIVSRRRERQVEGLTTAASILFTAAVGVCVALSQLVLAVGATGLVLVTLRGLGLLEARLARRRAKLRED